MALSTLMLAGHLLFSLPSADEGTISGLLVNASRQQAPVAGADVVLRVDHDGELVPVAESKTDDQGRFLFKALPIGPDYLYLPGGNRDGVHYPGPRVRLSPQQPHQRVTIPVYDSVAEPNPLLALQHNIVVRPETGALKITESLLISNPTLTTYTSGKTNPHMSVTLRLSIPPDFERVTFHKEFFGRRFQLINGMLVTSVPWPPGQKWLEFTYFLPVARGHYVWQRTLDLPCSDVTVRVVAEKPNQVSCNLPPSPTKANGTVLFESKGTDLPAGHQIRLELGRVPVFFISVARWVALAALGGLLALAILIAVMRRAASQKPDTGPPAQPQDARRPSMPSGDLSRRSRRRRGSLVESPAGHRRTSDPC